MSQTERSSPMPVAASSLNCPAGDAVPMWALNRGPSGDGATRRLDARCGLGCSEWATESGFAATEAARESAEAAQAFAGRAVTARETARTRAVTRILNCIP